MRIIGGMHKGKRIAVSKAGIRPTKGIVREAIFDIIGSKIKNSNILDLFSGSGALGIEALSRGADRCTFVDNNPQILILNIERFRLRDKTTIVRGDFRRALKKLKGNSFDVILIDPPYETDYIMKVLFTVGRLDLLKKDGLIIAEHSNKKIVYDTPYLSILKRKEYGDSAVTLLVKNEEKENK